MSNWTPERLERAKQLRRDGCSFGRVADLLGGVTRNAVIGKLGRASFKEGNKSQGRSAHDRPRNLYRARADSVSRTRKPDSKPVVQTEPVRFLDRRMSDGLGNGQCSAIINDGAPIETLMVCGGPVPEGSQFEFCEAHQSRFLVPVRRAPNVYGVRAA